MEKGTKISFIIVLLSTITIFGNAQTCDLVNSYGASLGMCSCQPNQVKINNTCLNCNASNCLICSLQNQNECDVCASGYILDTLTKGQCVLAANSQPVCTSLTCACSPMQVNDNGVCKSCNVSNCLLCAFGKPNECDVCKNGYEVDKLNGYRCASSLVCTSASCLCNVFQIYQNGICKNCTVKNCFLCSVGNSSRCDVCAPGYVFDQLTGLTCVQAKNSQPVCTSSSCLCSPYQSIVSGVCQNCSVLYCQLCEVNDNNKCDVCKPTFTINSVTKQCDPPVCTGGKKWIGSKCTCTQKTYEDLNGQCKQNLNENRLGLVLGLSIPLVAISAVLIILANLKLSASGAPQAATSFENQGSNVRIENKMPDSSKDKVILRSEQIV